MVNEYYVIMDLENYHQYLDDKGQLGVFKNAKEFFSKIDTGRFLIEKAPPGHYKITTVYRVIEY